MNQLLQEMVATNTLSHKRSHCLACSEMPHALQTAARMVHQIFPYTTMNKSVDIPACWEGCFLDDVRSLCLKFWLWKPSTPNLRRWTSKRLGCDSDQLRNCRYCVVGGLLPSASAVWGPKASAQPRGLPACHRRLTACLLRRGCKLATKHAACLSHSCQCLICRAICFTTTGTAAAAAAEAAACPTGRLKQSYLTWQDHQSRS